MRRTILYILVALGCALRPAPVSGQASDFLAHPLWAPLPLLGGDVDERLRLAALFGRDSTSNVLLRSPSTIASALPSEGLAWRLISPEVQGAWNSSIPFSQNDGAMWAGRGASLRAIAGVRARWGRVSLVVAPELTYSENRGIDSLRLSDQPGRSPFAPSWQTGRHSIDLPVRFGSRPFTRLYPGQSTLAVDVGPASVGASTENQWWGPGIRNAIVMSSNAAGVPHLFLRTRRPVETPVGSFEARWMVGSLTESPYFDTLSVNDTRSLSAVAATYRPRWEPGLTLGVARAVYARSASPGRALLHVGDALLAWPGERMDSATYRGREQILSLFGRWVFPSDGLEVYGEWARYELPVSLRDLLADPGHTQGFTGGVQWATPTGPSSALRVQAELTYLEQDPSYRVRPIGSFYSSRWVTQGYTERGQAIGAAIGPGSSSQWLAVDHFGSFWKLGAYGGRIRWQNDAYYDSGWQTKHLGIFGHDVSMLAGVRGGITALGTRVEADISTAKRYNFLFQNRQWDFFEAEQPGKLVDVRNHTLRLTVTPFAGR